MASPSKSPKQRQGQILRLRGVPVLIVDDIEVDLKLMRVVLAAEGCDVRTVRNPQDAVALVSTFVPRVVVTDVRLGESDGLQLTRQLKAGRATRDIAIVVVSAYDGEQQARAAGCDGFIAKPIDVHTFPEQILALLASSSGGQS
jgi:two-component system cell cycle response regulator DivK